MQLPMVPAEQHSLGMNPCLPRGSAEWWHLASSLSKYTTRRSRQGSQVQPSRWLPGGPARAAIRGTSRQGASGSGSGHRPLNSQTTTPQQREDKCHHARQNDTGRVGGRKVLSTLAVGMSSAARPKLPSMPAVGMSSAAGLPESNLPRPGHTTEKAHRRTHPDSRNGTTAPSRRGSNGKRGHSAGRQPTPEVGPWFERQWGKRPPRGLLVEERSSEERL